jgi:homoserine kinase type II
VLAEFGLPPETHAVPAERGLMNRHWFLDEGPRRLVLRQYNAARSSEAVAWEQALVRHAADADWPTPKPLPTAGGETVVRHSGHLWSLAPFLPGEPELAPTPERWALRGKLLARLHADLASFENSDQRPGVGSVIDLDAWLAGSGLTFEKAVATLAETHPELAGHARERRERSLEELARLGFDALPRQAIHGDFQDYNLLWSGHELTGLLDFDSARLDAPVVDLAVMLMPFMPLSVEETAALLRGYESVRQLSPQERASIPALVRAHVLWWVATLLGGFVAGSMPYAIAGLTRTLTVRFPALDEADARWRAAGLF